MNPDEIDWLGRAVDAARDGDYRGANSAALIHLCVCAQAMAVSLDEIAHRP